MADETANEDFDAWMAAELARIHEEENRLLTRPHDAWTPRKPVRQRTSKSAPTMSQCVSAETLRSLSVQVHRERRRLATTVAIETLRRDAGQPDRMDAVRSEIMASADKLALAWQKGLAEANARLRTLGLAGSAAALVRDQVIRIRTSAEREGRQMARSVWSWLASEATGKPASKMARAAWGRVGDALDEQTVARLRERV